MRRDLFARHEPPPAPATPAPVSIKPVPALLIDGHEVQRCAICREPASFGFGRDMKRGRPGVWFCFAHKEQGR